jgi:hypothetical protein
MTEETHSFTNNKKSTTILYAILELTPVTSTFKILPCIEIESIVWRLIT